jgi:hypothetical protein
MRGGDVSEKKQLGRYSRREREGKRHHQKRERKSQQGRKRGDIQKENYRERCNGRRKRATNTAGVKIEEKASGK